MVDRLGQHDIVDLKLVMGDDYRSPFGGAQASGCCLYSYNQSDLVDERFRLSGIRCICAQLGKLGLKTWVG
jgi:hypothetical protein